MENALNLDTVRLAENKKEIVILDQTLLPNQCKYLRPFCVTELLRAGAGYARWHKFFRQNHFPIRALGQ